MRDLKVEKTYDKFSETTKILIGNDNFHFYYYASPTSEELVFSTEDKDRSHWGFSRIIVLIDDKYRYQEFSLLSKEDLLRFCNAKSIEINKNRYYYHDSTLLAKSAIPAAKLMYNTLYSPNYYDVDEIQREWRDTALEYDRIIKQVFFLKEHGWKIVVTVLVLGSIAGLIIWMLKDAHAI